MVKGGLGEDYNDEIIKYYNYENDCGFYYIFSKNIYLKMSFAYYYFENKFFFKSKISVPKFTIKTFPFQND